MMDRLKQPGGRFYLIGFYFGGAAIITMIIAALFEIAGHSSGFDYQGFAIGIGAILSAIGIGSGASKYGSAQHKRYERDEP